MGAKPRLASVSLTPRVSKTPIPPKRKATANRSPVLKRHIYVDTEGLPHAISVTTANITDRQGALTLAKRYKTQLSNVHRLIVDGGYSGPKFAETVEELLGAVVEVAKRSELHRFKVIPKRWAVERDFGWLEKQRRLWKNCERKLHTSEQMVVLAFVTILVRRF